MEVNWPHMPEPENTSSGAKAVGIALLAAGILLAGWVVHVIYRLIEGGDASGIVSRLIPLEAIEKTVKTPSEAIVLPDSFFYIVGIVVCVMLLGICAGLAKTLIVSGARIMQPGYTSAMRKISKAAMEQKEKGGTV